MTVVFFIILFCIVLAIILNSSTIRIRVQDFYFSNKTKNKWYYDYTICLEIQLWKRITIFKIAITKEKIKQLVKKIDLKKKVENTNFRKVKEELPSKRELREQFKKLDINIEEFHLKLEFGTQDVIITSAILTILASLLGGVFARYIHHYEKEKYEYKMTPIYENKNIVKLFLNCIIQVRLVHIIRIIYYFIKKRKENKKYERTSNRRSYDYSYGQY